MRFYLFFLFLFCLLSVSGSAVPDTNEFQEVKKQYVMDGDYVFQNCMMIQEGSTYPVYCSDCIANATIVDPELSESIVYEMEEYQSGRFRFPIDVSFFDVGEELDMRVDCYSTVNGVGPVYGVVIVGEEPPDEAGVWASIKAYYDAALASLGGGISGIGGGITSSIFPPIILGLFEDVSIILDLLLGVLVYLIDAISIFFAILAFMINLALDPTKYIPIAFNEILIFIYGLFMANFVLFFVVEISITVISFERTANKGLFAWGMVWLDLNYKALNFIYVIINRLVTILAMVAERMFTALTSIGRASPL